MKNRAAWVFLAAGAALAACTLRWFPWGWVRHPLTSVQFPWRFNAFSQLLFCLGIACFAARLDQRPGKGRAALALALSLVNLACLWPAFPERVEYGRDHFTMQRGETFYLVGAEWLPAGVDAQEFAFEQGAQWTNREGAFTGSYLPNGDFALGLPAPPAPTASRSCGTRGIPPGWTRRTVPPGWSWTCTKDGAGRVELEVPEGLPTGSITVSYTGTAAQHAGNWVSGLSAVGLTVGGAWYCLRKRRAKR